MIKYDWEVRIKYEWECRIKYDLEGIIKHDWEGRIYDLEDIIKYDWEGRIYDLEGRIEYDWEAGWDFFLCFLWTVVESSIFPVKYTGYQTEYFILDTFQNLVAS